MPDPVLIPDLPCPTCGYNLVATPIVDDRATCPECGVSSFRSDLVRHRSRSLVVSMVRAVLPALLPVALFLASEAAFYAIYADPFDRPGFYTAWLVFLGGLAFICAVVAPVRAALARRTAAPHLLWIILRGWLFNSVILAGAFFLWIFLAVFVGGVR